MHGFDARLSARFFTCQIHMQVLDELEVSGIPVVTSWNKIDACANPAEVSRKSVAFFVTALQCTSTCPGLHCTLISGRLHLQPMQARGLHPSTCLVFDDVVQHDAQCDNARYHDAR